MLLAFTTDEGHVEKLIYYIKMTGRSSECHSSISVPIHVLKQHITHLIFPDSN